MWLPVFQVSSVHNAVAVMYLQDSQDMQQLQLCPAPVITTAALLFLPVLFQHSVWVEL